MDYHHFQRSARNTISYLLIVLLPYFFITATSYSQTTGKISGRVVEANTKRIWHTNAHAMAFDLGLIISTHFFSPTGKHPKA